MIFKENIDFEAIGIKSANDCPNRDPHTIELAVFDDSREIWVPTFKTTNVRFADRWSTNIYRVPPCSTRAITVKLTANDADLQIGQIRLYH